MHFHTATLNSWKHLLKHDEFKDIIIDSLRWLDANSRVKVYAFVIMPNHIHLLWNILETSPQHPAQSLASFTAHKFKEKLVKEQSALLNEYISTQADRDYHFWERRPKSINILNRPVAIQKLNYIHNNPLQEHWKLAKYPEDYHYSSAAYYIKGIKNFPFLTHLFE